MKLWLVLIVRSKISFFTRVDSNRILGAAILIILCDDKDFSILKF